MVALPGRAAATEIVVSRAARLVDRRPRADGLRPLHRQVRRRSGEPSFCPGAVRELTSFSADGRRSRLRIPSRSSPDFALLVSTWGDLDCLPRSIQQQLPRDSRAVSALSPRSPTEQPVDREAPLVELGTSLRSITLAQRRMVGFPGGSGVRILAISRGWRSRLAPWALVAAS